MEFRKMTMKMLADFCAVSSGALLQFWRDEAQGGLTKGQADKEPGAIQFFTDAIECIDAEMTKRTKSAEVPAAVVELLRHMTDDALVRARETVGRTTMPPGDELRIARVGTFTKAVNAELDARSKLRGREKDRRVDPLAGMPTDLRAFFADMGPEEPKRETPFAEAVREARVGIAFTLVQLEYLGRAVSAYHDPNPGDEEIAEAVLQTVALARSVAGLT